METITLQYDAMNQEAQSLIQLIEESGLFLILKDDVPNDLTIKAINEAKEGKTFKAKKIQDMINYLIS